MNSLTIKAIVGFVKKVVIVSLLLFVPAGSLDFWEAWLFLAIFFVPQLLIIIYFLRNDRGLVERRLKGGALAENRTRQKVIMSLIQIFFILMMLVPGYDHRFSGSHVPAFLVIAADALVLLGFWIQFHAFKANTFASAIIAIVPKQAVISRGPYAVVRHPMYSGSLVVDCSVPIALGSWWGLPFALAKLVVIILRLLDEEKLLHQSLPGYEEYCRKVQYRLIPHLW